MKVINRIIALSLVILVILSFGVFANAAGPSYIINSSTGQFAVSNGGTAELTLTDAESGEIANVNTVWLSSDPTVATVSSEGVLTAKKVGEITVSCISATNNEEYANCEIRIVDKPEKITVSVPSATLVLGAGTSAASLKLDAEVYPDDTFFKSVKWVSSDETVATVDQTGKVKAVSAGEAVITAVSEDANFTNNPQCKITVEQAVTGISIPSDLVLYVGSSQILEAGIMPENATNKSLSWSTSDDTVATVAANGNVTAKNTGVATVTCTALDEGGKTASCKVEVRRIVQGLQLSDANLTLVIGAQEGSRKQLTCSVLPDDAYEKGLTWTSSDETVATVDANGLITALAQGETEIMVISDDPAYTKPVTCKVKVEQGVSSIEMSDGEVVYTGTTLKLEPEVYPEDAANKNLEWESSEPEIASVDQNGNITVKKAGVVTITCKAKDGSGTYSECKLDARSKVKGLTITGNTSLLLGAGEDAAISQLTTVTNPEDAYIQDATWSSSDESVAIVDENGLVTALAFGKATISAVSRDPDCQTPATVEVTVSQAVTDIVLGETETQIYTGSSLKLEATALPEDAANRQLEWSSSDPEIAAVDKNGVVSAKSVGKATILCSASDGSGLSTSVDFEVIAAVKGLAISNTKAQLVLGSNDEARRIQLSCIITPEDAYCQSVTWSSSDEEVATVDENGIVTAQKEGTATITALSDDEAYTKPVTCIITVGQAVRTITFENGVTSMSKGSSQRIQTILQPENPLNSKLAWSSSDENVARVADNGTVSAVGVGTATILCEATDGSHVSQSMDVTVYQPVTGIKAINSNLVIFAGQTVSLQYTVSPEDATDNSVTWSTDSSCVSVRNGEITGQSSGTAKVTVSANDGSGKSAVFTVTVEPACPVTLTGLGTGVYNGNLLSLTFQNVCSKTTVKDIYFDCKLLSYNGTTISEGSYHTDTIYLGPKQSTVIKRTLSGVSYASKYQITITGVLLSDGTEYYVPYGSREISSWG